MVKHIIEFSLPEDQHELQAALDGTKVKAMLFEFGEWLNRRYKHQDPKSEDVLKEHEEIRSKFFEMLAEDGVEYS